MSQVEKLFTTNNLITNKQAEGMGVKRHTLAKLVKEGTLERVKNGVYKVKASLDDEFAALTLNNHRVVFSYHTALYLLGYSDRTPSILHITVPQGYNVQHIASKFDHLKVHYVKEEVFQMGRLYIETPLGSEVPCYNIERCICDMILERRKVDKQIFVHALKEYFSSQDKDLRKLIGYSRTLGIEDEIRKYTEVL